RRRRHGDGAEASPVPDSRRAVSSRVDHDARRIASAEEFSERRGEGMSGISIPALLEKLMRRENLTLEESAAAMDAIMSGTATPAQIGSLLIGLTMKGERPIEIVGLRRTMRGHAGKVT